MNFKYLFLVLIVSSWAQAKETTTTTSTTIKSVHETVKEAVISTEERVQLDMELGIESLKAQVARLKAKAVATQGSVKKDMDSQIASLEKDQAAAEASLAKMKQSSGKAWQDMKTGTSEAYERFKKSVQTAKQRFKD